MGGSSFILYNINELPHRCIIIAKENESISSSFTGFKLYFLLVLILEIWIFMEAMGERGKKKERVFFLKKKFIAL